MTEETKEFVSTWQKRLSEYTDDDLGSLFDKYTALFTLYNRLYNESFSQMEANKQLSKSRYSDYEKATQLVVEFSSAEDIIERLKVNGNLSDIDAICELIRNEKFNINLANGASERDVDIQLTQNLDNDQSEIKAKAILSTIYNVRCNMYHGEKHFREHQRMLLEPLIRILETFVELQIEKLKEEG